MLLIITLRYVKKKIMMSSIRYCNQIPLQNIVERAKQLTNGKGVEYWMDNISSESAALSFDALAFGGGLVCIAGTPSGEAYSAGKWATKALSIHSVLLGMLLYAIFTLFQTYQKGGRCWSQCASRSKT